MTPAPNPTRLRSPGAAWTHCRAAGVTLVELLLYISSLSLVSIGLMQMVLDVQRSNIEFLGFADQLPSRTPPAGAGETRRFR